MMLRRPSITQPLKDDIIAQIQSATLTAGDPVLSINALKAKYNISKGSVEKAVKELMAAGFLDSIPGKGYFVSNQWQQQIQPTQSKHIGLTYAVHAERLPLIRTLEEHVLSRGGLLTVYNVSEDNQDPLKEKRFLEKMVQLGTSGIAVFASPHAPLNTALYQQLREQGVKLALITPHQYDVSEEVCFLRDQRSAGRLLVQQAVHQGYQQLIYQTPDFPFGDWLREGICYEAGKKGIPCAPFSSFHDHADLESKTAFLLTSYELCQTIMARAKANNWSVPGDIGICSCVRLTPSQLLHPVSFPQFPEEQLLLSAVDYLLNDTLPATLPVQHWFKPQFIDHQTL